MSHRYTHYSRLQCSHSACTRRCHHRPPLVATVRDIHPCGDCHGSGGRSTTAPSAQSINAPYPIHHRDSIQPNLCVSNN
eukprot:scaffold103734_cov63-Attheya_sp.AAC.1